MEVGKWAVYKNCVCGDTYYVLRRQFRACEPGEPIHAGVLETYKGGTYITRDEAQKKADELNSEVMSPAVVGVD